MLKIYLCLCVAMLVSTVTSSGQCTSDSDCSLNLIQTSCCAESSKDGDSCHAWCATNQNASQQDTTQGAFEGFDNGAFDTTYNSCAVDQISGESNLINNFRSAHQYGSQKSYYQMSGQINVIAKRFIQLQNGQCESTFDKIFDEVSTIVEDVHGVLSFLCKYKDLIMHGEEVVGFPEAAPITEEVCSIKGEVEFASEIVEQSMFIVKAYEESDECSELRYEINQFVNLWDQSTYISYQLGDLAGRIYKYNKACQDQSNNIQQALSYLQSDIKELKENASSGVEIQTIAQKRRLSSTNITPPDVQNKTYFTPKACKYCLDENDLIQYLQGVYDGQRIIDASMNATEVRSCIQRSPELETLFTGALQSHLSSIMTEYSMNASVNETLESLYTLDVLVSSALQNCSGITRMTNFNEKVQPVVNGTKWTFLNKDGMQIQIQAIPQLTALFYEKYLDSDHDGKRNTTYLYSIGKQLGLGTKLFSMRGMPVKTDYVPIYFGVGLVLIGLVTAGFFLRRKYHKNAEPQSISSSTLEENATLQENASKVDDEVLNSVN